MGFNIVFLCSGGCVSTFVWQVPTPVAANVSFVFRVFCGFNHVPVRIDVLQFLCVEINVGCSVLLAGILNLVEDACIVLAVETWGTVVNKFAQRT